MEGDQEKPNSCGIKQENFSNGAGSSNFKRSRIEPIVNSTEGGDNVDDDTYLDSFPPGFRFCPLDEELIIHYLQKKVMNLPLPPNRITDVNLYSYNPERLAELYKHYGEKEWYFFTPREKKYRNGTRPNRSAGDGYWKATGADRNIYDENCRVGFRKSLVFYKGKAPKGDKTSWIMHEYRVADPPSPKKDKDSNDMRLDDYVLCRIYKKPDSKSVRTESKTDDLTSGLIQNEEANEFWASDELMDCAMNGFFMDHMSPEESLNNFQQIFNEQFPAPIYDNFGSDDNWNIGNFVDFASPLQIFVEPMINSDTSPVTSKAESQESRNDEFKEDESVKEYQRKFYDFGKQ